MAREVLCIYYSRTGKTRQVMESIAAALGGEMFEVTDAVDRQGLRGFFRCALDAVRRDVPDTVPLTCEGTLEAYRLVILGSPVWAGRCSSVIRSFLKHYGGRMERVAYVLTRGTEHRDESIFRQMDLYTAKPHRCAVSLRVGAVGQAFWQDEFIRQAREILRQDG